MTKDADHLDGCALDFAAHAIDDDEADQLLADLEQEAAPLGDRLLASVGFGFDVTLADRLRRDGLNPIEVPGWKTRGRGPLVPRGAVTHHTAGPRATASSRKPSLGIVINGRPDLTGPLCNTYIDFDDRVYVIAAGKANHAGLPDRPAVTAWASGNSNAWGLEVEHPGTFPLPTSTARIAARVQAATIRGTVGANRVVYHLEWTRRKIDLATAPSPTVHREQVAQALAASSTKRRTALRLWILARRAEGWSWTRIKQTSNWREFLGLGGK